MSNSIHKVLLVDDHPAVRHGIALLLSSQADFEVVGEASSGSELMEKLKTVTPDLIIMDISLVKGGLSGLDLLSQVRASQGNDTRVLIYTMHDDSYLADLAFKSGASGYLTKQEPTVYLLEAARAVAAGGVYISPSLVNELLAKHLRPDEQNPRPEERLSQREFEVFRLIARGLQPRHIAKTIALSTRTVEVHRRSIRKKLNLADADELLRYAIDWHRKQRLGF